MRSFIAAIISVSLASGCAGLFRDALPAAPTERGSAEIGVTYRYDLYDHCGLYTVPIEFDGSEWWIESQSGYPNPPEGFGNPVDEGTITLDSADTGIYRSSGGVERRISRADPAQPRPSYVGGCI